MSSVGFFSKIVGLVATSLIFLMKNFLKIKNNFLSDQVISAQRLLA